MTIADDDIRWLMSLVETENLAEIEVHVGDSEVLVRRQIALPAGAEICAAAAAPLPPEDTEPPLPENVVPVLAPMHGLFYRAASPESPPYVEVGQAVQVGDILGLIEAMKLFNDVTAPVAGTVVRILVANGQQVEAGTPLMLLETAP